MSVQSFIDENPEVLKTVRPKEFFARFTHDTFEVGIDFLHIKDKMEMDFITIDRDELNTFCLLHDIRWITYFMGGERKFIVRLSQIDKINAGQ